MGRVGEGLLFAFSIVFLLRCARLALPFDKVGGGSAMKRKTSFSFALRSPCTTFAV